MPPTATLSPPLDSALGSPLCLDAGFEPGDHAAAAGPAAILAELRRIAEAHRSLAPHFRGLQVATTPNDSDLAGWTVTVEEGASQVLAGAEALLGLLATAELPASLDDLASLVAAEIDGQVRLVRQALSKKAIPIWEQGSLAQGLSSKSLKAAIALENAYCELLGCERRLTLQSEIEDALAVRQAYCKLWCSLPATSTADPAQVETGLRRGSTAIAVLLGRDVFLDLRFHDRRLILSMQRRIRRWLAGRGESEAGQPLLQDLANLFCLLSQINNRIELLMHDEALVKNLQARLRAASLPRPLSSADLRAAIWPLLGRDAELDQMLLGHCWDTPQAELERVLSVIALRWNRPSRPSPAAPFHDAGNSTSTYIQVSDKEKS